MSYPEKLQYGWHCHVPAFGIRLAGGLHKSENKSRSYRQLGDKGRSGMAGKARTLILFIPMSQLQVDDCIRVRTGSVIPVDGQITEGEAYINEASMTGEPLAVMKSAGASVFAGTVVEEGSVVIKVRKLSSDTKISKIIELIDNSENLKAGVQSKAERLADSIVPYSFLAFGLTLLFTRNVTKAVSVLMVDYSCAIKLSTPIAVISAIKEAADDERYGKGWKIS